MESQRAFLFTVSSTAEHALAVVAPLWNDPLISSHVKVFSPVPEHEGWGGYPNESLFIVLR